MQGCKHSLTGVNDLLKGCANTVYSMSTLVELRLPVDMVDPDRRGLCSCAQRSRVSKILPVLRR